MCSWEWYILRQNWNGLAQDSSALRDLLILQWIPRTYNIVQIIETNTTVLAPNGTRWINEINSHLIVKKQNWPVFKKNSCLCFTYVVLNDTPVIRTGFWNVWYIWSLKYYTNRTSMQNVGSPLADKTKQFILKILFEQIKCESDWCIFCYSGRFRVICT